MKPIKSPFKFNQINSLTTSFQIEDCFILVDSVRTKEFYLTEEKITDDCECADCKFYSETFTKKPFEIFSILSSMGVDLEKNLTSEPTGVWCIRDENENFLHCEQVYQAVGQILPEDKTQVKYEKEENGCKINALFLKENTDTISIDLLIDKV